MIKGWEDKRNRRRITDTFTYCGALNEKKSKLKRKMVTKICYYLSYEVVGVFKVKPPSFRDFI